MQIRDVTQDDFEAIAALTNHYVEHTAVHFGTAPVTADELRMDWQKTRDRYGFVVADDGELAGFAKAMTFRSRPAYGWTAEVGVYVHDAKQRRGVARALYERLFDVSRRQGFHLLVAGIALPNEASVALHERMGFTSVGVFREVGFKRGSFHDVGFWQRALSPSDGAPSPIKSPLEVA
jgi:phosphinothricin acetyltransferase